MLEMLTLMSSIKTVNKTDSFIAKFVVLCCAFCKLQRNFGFFCSGNHLSGPLGKHTFTCDWYIWIHFVCFCVLRFVDCDQPVLGNNRLVFFEDISDHSYSCLLPSTKSPLIIMISFAILEQSRVIIFSVLFLQAKLGGCFALWFALTPPPLK